MARRIRLFYVVGTMVATLLSFGASAQNENGSVRDVYMLVTEQPEPLGGMESFYDYLDQRLGQFSQQLPSGHYYRAFVQFIVEDDGGLSNIEIIKEDTGKNKRSGKGSKKNSVDDDVIKSLRENVEIVVSDAPIWNPGQLGTESDRRAVAVRMVVPVIISSNENDSKQ